MSNNKILDDDNILCSIIECVFIVNKKKQNMI